MGSAEDQEAEVMAWARYRVSVIVSIGLLGTVSIVVGVLWRRPFGFPGLAWAAIAIGIILILWALGRAYRRCMGVAAYNRH